MCYFYWYVLYFQVQRSSLLTEFIPPKPGQLPVEIDNGSAGMSVNPVQSPHKEHKGMCYLHIKNIKVCVIWMSVSPVQSPHKEHTGMCYLNVS